MRRFVSVLFIFLVVGGPVARAQDPGSSDPKVQAQWRRLMVDPGWQTSITLGAAQSNALAYGFPTSGMLMTNALMDGLKEAVGSYSKSESFALLEKAFAPCLWNFALSQTRAQTQEAAQAMDKKQNPKFALSATLLEPVRFYAAGIHTELTCMEYESVHDEAGPNVDLKLSFAAWKDGEDRTKDARQGEVEIEGFNRARGEDLETLWEKLRQLQSHAGPDLVDALILCLVPNLPK